MQIWGQLREGWEGSSQQGPVQQLSEAAQRLPAELCSILMPETGRDVQACREYDQAKGPVVLVVAEPSARLSSNELKWAGMIARKVAVCLQQQVQLQA